MIYFIDKWSKFQHITMLRLISNNNNELQNRNLKQLLKKSIKIVSMTLGISLLAVGGYSLGWMCFLIY